MPGRTKNSHILEEACFAIPRRTRRATDEKGVEGHDNRPLIHDERNRRAGLGTRDAMADTAMGPPPLERQESVPMEIMNKCAYGEPSTKTIMVMGAVAAVLASITVYLSRPPRCRNPQRSTRPGLGSCGCVGP